MVQLASSNKHFDIPQAVSSIFTGRESQLEELRAAFLSPMSEGKSRMQRRFVISGLGGSGKTQWFVSFRAIQSALTLGMRPAPRLLI